jgi:hypothetical protein
MLIQSGLASGSPAYNNIPGGYMAELPKDLLSTAIPQAWSYRSIIADADFVLNGETGWTEWDVQIDCHGYSGDAMTSGAADAITLARAIVKVLRGGYRGYLADPDNTYVFGIFRRPPFVDGYSDVNRSFVRSLEYRIQYQQI